ncbi:hypothetical protein ACPTKS_30770 [Pseudomonas aeruginosa]|uniref:hypothetical protein n=1 Tax=Pseudomonas aeruginosa TaxID=287 RepID=UPI003CC51496
MQKVFYVPGQTAIIDYAREIAPDMWAARCSWLMLPEIRIRYPGAVLGDEEHFLRAQEAAHGTRPQPTSADQFVSALRTGPVLDFHADNAGESFIVQGRVLGDLARIYARRGSRHWSFLALPTITHAEIWHRIRKDWPRLNDL